MSKKGPPYKVEDGPAGQAPPPFVAAIHNGRIMLTGATEALAKLRLKSELSFHESGNVEENKELIALMLKLHQKGLVFSCDHEAPLSPSGLMCLLQDNGILTSAFKEICWRARGEWYLTTY